MFRSAMVDGHDCVVFNGVIYCGERHCSGWCGFPALMVGDRLKAVGACAACCPVMDQPAAVWRGRIVQVPDELVDDARRCWWL